MKQFIYTAMLWLMLGLVACSSASPTPTAVNVTEVAAATLVPPTAVPSHTAAATDTATAVATEAPSATPEPTASPTRPPTQTPTEKATTGPNIRPSATAGAIKTIATSVPATKPPTSEATAVGATPIDDDMLALLENVLIAESELHSLRQQQQIISYSSLFTQTMSLDCQQEKPNAYCLIEIQMEITDMAEPITMSLEMLILGKEYWVREDANGAWEPIPEEALAEAGLDNFDVESSFDPTYIISAELMGTELLDGIETYKISAEVDVQAYYAAHPDQLSEDLQLSDEVEMEMTFWIDVEMLVTRQMELNMTNVQTSVGEVSTHISFINSQINEPMNIPERPSR